MQRADLFDPNKESVIASVKIICSYNVLIRDFLKEAEKRSLSLQWRLVESKGVRITSTFSNSPSLPQLSYYIMYLCMLNPCPLTTCFSQHLICTAKLSRPLQAIYKQRSTVCITQSKSNSVK